ncbi:GntR family transcriptional regulator [Sporosarcina sp. FA9]|uniref:GntR family transcriptional regulator n=1 Tax=Sporosarcina sp. FA9 TaxID=3413030 RepID=UPI003F65E730
MLERNQTIPLYEQLKKVIENQIISGELKSNEQIPSERELGEKYSVSRITVRQAISMAEKEKLVTKVHGVGTFVTNTKIRQELNIISSFQSTLEQLGLIASTKTLNSNIITSDFQLSRLLNLEVMDKVLNLQLLGSGDNSPIVYYNTYFSYKLGEEMEGYANTMIDNKRPFSTLDLYKHSLTYQPTHVEQTFESVLAMENIATVLQIENGFPLLRVTSIIYQDEQPLEYKESYYKGDMYKFFITRKIEL